MLGEYWLLATQPQPTWLTYEMIEQKGSKETVPNSHQQIELDVLVRRDLPLTIELEL